MPSNLLTPSELHQTFRQRRLIGILLSIGCVVGLSYVLNSAAAGAEKIIVFPVELVLGTLNSPYREELRASREGSKIFFFSIEERPCERLPLGLELEDGRPDDQALIVGTPQEAGLFTFTVKVTAGNGTIPAYRTFSLLIKSNNDCPGIGLKAVGPVQTTAQLEAEYNQVFTVEGGTAPYDFELEPRLNERLPRGLRIEAQGDSLQLIGKPEEAGTFRFTLRVQLRGNTCFGVLCFELKVRRANCNTLILSPKTLPDPIAALSQAPLPVFRVAEGQAPYTFSLDNEPGESLPPGLALAQGDAAGLPVDQARLTGTPSQPGTYNFTLKVVDSLGCTERQSYTLVVVSPLCPPITLTPEILPRASTSRGTDYSQTFSARGGEAPYLFTAANLPTGLQLSPGARADQVSLNGQPSISGTFVFTLKAQDKNQCVGTRTYVLNVQAPPCPLINLTPETLPNGRVDEAYLQSLTAGPAPGPYTFTVSSGQLPPGLTLSAAGLLQGKPTQGGSFSFTITAGNPNNCTGSRVYTVTIAAAPPCQNVLVLQPAVLPKGTRGVAYPEVRFAVTGGNGPFTFEATGLPSGLRLSPQGLLTGTPTVEGEFSLTVRASNGQLCGSRTYVLTVYCADSICDIEPPVLPPGKVGASYAPIIFSNRTASFSGTLPKGMTLVNGVLSGQPEQAGVFAFSLTANAAANCPTCAPQTYQLLVAGCTTTDPLIDVAPKSFSSGTVGAAYGPIQFSATGGTPPYTLALSGRLPTGLNFSEQSAQLSGTPVEAGVFTLTLTARSADACVAGTRSYLLVIACESLPASETTPAGNNGPLCLGTTLQLTTPSLTGASYRWLGPNGFTSTEQNPNLPNVSAAAAGEYVVTVSLNGCPQKIGSTNLTINSPPAQPSPQTIELCEGSLLQLSAPSVPNASYRWTGPDNYVSNEQNPTVARVTLKNQGDYFVTVTVNGCASVPGKTTVSIKPLPTASTKPELSGCLGSALMLTVDSVKDATYRWTGPNGFVSTDQNPTISNLTVEKAGDYFVTVTLNGCAAVGQTTLRVNAPPAPPITLANISVCQGSALRLPAQAADGATYRWTGPGGFTSDLANPELASVTPDQAGDYFVTATINGCTSAPSKTTVAVSPLPVAIPKSELSGCLGSALLLMVQPVAGATYRWSGPAGFASTEQNPVLSNLTAERAGDYFVTVTVNGCSSIPGKTTVSVVAPPAPPITQAALSACAGTPLRLVAQAVTGASYRWTGPNGFTSDEQNPVLPSLTPNQAGDYFVTATLNGCASAASKTTVTALPKPPTPQPPATLTACEGAAITLSTPSVPGASYRWTGPLGFVSTEQNPVMPTATLNREGAYTVTVTLNGCPSDAGTTMVTVSPLPAINPPVLDRQTINRPFSRSLRLDAERFTYTVAGNLPPGVVFDAATGVLSGTPREGGLFRFKIRAQNEAGCFNERDEYMLVVGPIHAACLKPEAISINPTSFPRPVLNQAYAPVTFTATGGNGTYTLELAGTLPSGMSFANGVLSGTPTSSGSFAFTVAARYADPCAPGEFVVGSRAYAFTVECEAEQITVTQPLTLPNGKVGQTYSSPAQSFEAAGGAGRYRYEVVGLPPGLSFVRGSLSGTPSAVGKFRVTISATDANRCAGSRSYDLTIDECPTLQALSALPAGRVETPYEQTITVEPANINYHFAVTSGALPDGLRLDSQTGKLSGTPTRAGMFPFSVTVTGFDGCPTVTQAYNVVIAAQPRADLAITNTNGVTQVSAGTAVNYTIVVSNSGPADVTGATVTDDFPASLTNLVFTCTGAGRANCPAQLPNSRTFKVTVNLPVGGSLTFNARATLAASATGTLANTATITAPADTPDPELSNNSATDGPDTITVNADLSITKTDGLTTVEAGGATTYTIVVRNAGPADVTGATVSDPLPTGVTAFAWRCNGCQNPTGSGPILERLDLAAGGSVTYTVRANVSSAATGTLVNTARVTLPAGVTDLAPDNNTATDTNRLTRSADLALIMVNQDNLVVPGRPVRYLIRVNNNGPSDVADALIRYGMPPQLTNVRWSCAATGGAECKTANGTGEFNVAANLPAFTGGLLFVVNADVASNATGTLINSANVTSPADVPDPLPRNNTAALVNDLTPVADLYVSSTMPAQRSYRLGGTTNLNFIFVVENKGPSDVQEALFSSLAPAGITFGNWTCEAGGGTGAGLDRCPASGAGDLSDIPLTLRPNGKATFTINASIHAQASGLRVITAHVQLPAYTLQDNTNLPDTASETLTPELDFGLRDPGRTPGQSQLSLPLLRHTGSPTQFKLVSILRADTGRSDGRDNDRRPFFLRRVTAQGVVETLRMETPLTLNAGDLVEVFFDPLIPDRRTFTLPASILSQLKFTLGDPTISYTSPLKASLNPALKLVHPCDAALSPVIGLERTGDLLTVSTGIYAPNLNDPGANEPTSTPYLARYEFLDQNGAQLGANFDIDLPASLFAGLAKGESFVLQQRFTGASRLPANARVRVVIFDRSSNAQAESAPFSCAINITAAEPAAANRQRLELPPRPLTMTLEPTRKAERKTP